MRIIDSAAATASTVAASIPGAVPVAGEAPECIFYATDSIEKFQRLGSAFLNQTVPAVELVDLGG